MNQPLESKKKIVGLAISGGWIRAAAAIGVIEILEENGIKISMVSGCSAGAIVASVYAAGSLDHFRKRFKSGKFREYWQVMFEPAFPRQGLLRGSRVKEFWKEFVGEKNFAELEKPLYLAATDLNSLSGVIIESGNVAEAMQACIGVPGMFVPVMSEEHVLSDGGNLNLIPSQILYDRGADYVIAVDISKYPNLITQTYGNFKKLIGHKEAVCLNKPKSCPRRLGLFRLMWRAANLTATHLKNFSHASYHYDILIRPDVIGVKRWDIAKVDYLVKRGREAALRQLLKIKHDLND